MSGTGGEAGFSLIEVLVSVFVFAVIGTISVALLASSLNAQEINREALDRTGMLDRTRTLLREDLGQIALRPVRDGEGYRRPEIFAGSGSGLRHAGAGEGERIVLVFTRYGRANPGLVRPRSSLVHVEYLVRDGDLVRRARDYPDAAPQTRIAEQVLAAGVTDVRIDFLTGAGWSRRALVAADGQGALPRAVRLRYSLPPLGNIEHLLLTPEARS
jgi:general secretion pathway protein J